MGRKFAITLLFMIAICISVGTMTRISYKDYSVLKRDRMDLFVVGSGGSISEETKDNKISDIESKSKAIVHVRYVGERKYLNKTVLSKVEVIEVYKGQESIDMKDKYIYVYEPSFFNFEKEYYMIVGAYTLMNENQEYILFLNNKSFPEAYKQSEKEKKEYVLTTNDSLSKYLISKEYQKNIIPNNSDYKYGEIKKYEVATQNAEQLKLYNDCKSDVLKKYVH